MRIAIRLSDDEIQTLADDFTNDRPLNKDFEYLACSFRQLSDITGRKTNALYWLICGGGLHRCPFWQEAYQVGRYWYVPLAVIWQHRDWLTGRG